jgi:hypothetical protein
MTPEAQNAQPSFLYTRAEVETMDPMTRRVFLRAEARGVARIVENKQVVKNVNTNSEN